MYRCFFKRIIDISLSFIILLFFLPVLLILIIFLVFANQGKPFFIQKRPGKDEKIFKILKFRTMNEKKDIHGNLLPDADRLTKIGLFVRKTSLDELPQLINVLKGDMSLIGPRPLLPEYLPLYNEFQKKRHYVRPGITGWAQINGRNTISWEDKFNLDVYYVDRISFILDVKIVWMTINKVLKREGISAVNNVTIERFNGNK